MGHSKLNKLLMYKRVINIVNEHHIEGVTSYAGIFRKYVYPVYPMTYANFMRIMNTSNIDKEIEEAKTLSNDTRGI